MCVQIVTLYTELNDVKSSFSTLQDIDLFDGV